MAADDKVPTKQFLRCPTCGASRDRSAFTKGALGRHAFQALRQQFVGRGNGTNGGAVIWSRRPMTVDELQHVGRALATACDSLLASGGELAVEEPAAVLGSIEDDEEADAVGAEWLAEAEDELERRRQIVQEDKQRRIFDR